MNNDHPGNETRRDFLRFLTSLTAGLLLPYGSHSTTGYEQDRLGYVLPRRKLGNTGESVTMLGTGGYHIGWTSEKDAREVIETALEGGIRFFDTAESYGPHTSEIRMGKYLTPEYRDVIFLMSKTYTQSADEARRHLEESLRRLKTDYLDLWQVHSLQSPDDVEVRIQDGILEVMQQAREEGKARHIGFTGHADPNAHLEMLRKTENNPIFETVQMPVNVVDANYRESFIRKVMPEASNRKMGILAMKTLADGRFFKQKNMEGREVWSSDDPVIGRITLKEALYFAWSLPVSVLITGAENAGMLQEKIEMAKAFTAIDEHDRNRILEKVADLADDGEVEYYKTV